MRAQRRRFHDQHPGDTHRIRADGGLVRLRQPEGRLPAGQAGGLAGPLGALSHGSASIRALAGAVPRGSVGMFIAAVSDFLGKDVAVVRNVAAELGADLGAVGDMINKATW